MSTSTTALILAGGLGARLEGRDKGLITVKNKPMIQYVIERLEPQTDEILINANRNLERYAAFKKPVLKDALSNFQGPLSGLLTGLKDTTSETLLMVPCDTPLIPEDLVTRLRKALNQSHADIAVVHDGRRPQQAHALIKTEMRESLEAFLATGQRSVRFWYQEIDVVDVDFSDRSDHFKNINTLAQLQEVEKLL